MSGPRDSAAAVAPADFTERKMAWTKLFFPLICLRLLCFVCMCLGRMSYFAEVGSPGLKRHIALTLRVSKLLWDKKQSGETPLSLADKRVKIIVFPRNLSASLFPSVLMAALVYPARSKIRGQKSTTISNSYVLLQRLSLDWSFQRLLSGRLVQLHAL